MPQPETAGESRSPMTAARAFPVAGVALALATAAGMLVAGSNVFLCLAVAVLWIGTLWLQAPEPVAARRESDGADQPDDALRETIEVLGQPLLLVEGSRIVMANAAARAALGAHISGQDARIALRHPEAMRLFDMGDGQGVTIPGFTGGRSLWQLTRRSIAGERWAVELTDRTAEADVGRAHTDFVANASHELRTPLASIIGYAETLGEPGALDDRKTASRFVGIIEREAQRMLALVEDLMTLSHVEAEKHDRPKETADLAALAARVTAEVATLKGKERVELGEAASGAMVHADTTQLEQLLRNLIDNALKYGDPNEPVRVAVICPQPGKVRLTVTDRGPGIAPEHLPHLTRRFYRTDPGRSRASGGTGLGLAIVKHIVERHGGQLDIASTLGEGTTVSVDFPPAPEG